MHAKHEHEVLIAEGAQPLALDRDYTRSFKELIDVETDRVKPRQNLPLDFQQVAPSSAVEGVLVSGFQVIALRCLRQSQAWFVSQLHQRLFGRQQVIGPDQQVEIRELAHGYISVQGFGQRRPFVRQHFQTTGLQMAMNVQQLERQPQSAVRVGLVLLAKRLQSRRASGVRLGGQPAKNQRYQPVMLCQLNQPLPIHAVPQNLLDTSGKVLVGIVTAAGENQIEFGTESSGVGSDRRGQPGWGRLWQGNGRGDRSRASDRTFAPRGTIVQTVPAFDYSLYPCPHVLLQQEYPSVIFSGNPATQ